MKNTDLHSPQELEEQKRRADYVRRLEERERALSVELANNHETIRCLRNHPQFLGAEEWERLKSLTDLIYKGYTQRLKVLFPHLTEVDIQFCILLKLRFTVSQIAVLMAVSPASVSVQKNRLKKRLLQTDEHLFADGTTLDGYLSEY